jgi:hypothetical protein
VSVGYDEEEEGDGEETEEDGGYETASQLLSGEASQSEVQPQLLPEDVPGMLHIIK